MSGPQTQRRPIKCAECGHPERGRDGRATHASRPPDLDGRVYCAPCLDDEGNWRADGTPRAEYDHAFRAA